MSANPSSPRQIIGESVVRKDVSDKVTGAAQYTADIPIDEIKTSGRPVGYGIVLRSPHHHARIIQIDRSNAQNLPGVLAIITSEDIPGKKVFGSLIEDQPPLADKFVRHMGEPVALVIAEKPELAANALEAIKVDYEVLPAVFDPISALEPDAPQVHSNGNILTVFDIHDGNVETAFLEADIILEHSFSVPRISPGYLETENSLARWNNDDSLTVWVNSQKPFDDRKQIASVLGLPEEKIQVISAVIGGAFGGKEDAGIQILTSLAAWIIKGTVRLANKREESFIGHPKRHPAFLHYKLGARKDGALLSLHAKVHLDTGAYASYGPAVGSLLTEMLPGPYYIPNVHTETFVVYTNCPFSGAMRGFGSPQAHYAIESMMDMLAIQLKLDPLEIRRINFLKPGDRLFTQVVVNNTAESLPLCLEQVNKAQKRLQKIKPSQGKISGVGFAMAMQSMGLGAKVHDECTNYLEWMPDGSVILSLGAPDLGQGLATVAEQIVANTLGIPFEAVKTMPIDTATSPDGGVSCASRMTYLVGNSVIVAAQNLISRLLDVACKMLKIDLSQLTYQNGVLIKANGVRLNISEFTSRAKENGERIIGKGTFVFPYPENNTPQHLPVGMPHIIFVFGAQVARVEIDPMLGIVEVTDIVAIHDVGKVINQAGVEGQIEGGVATGIGYALFENMALKQNHQWVNSFSEYLLVTAKDMPRLETVLLEIPEESGPHGAKGIGEIVLVPTAPAITNAIYNATGIRVQSLPVSPEQLITKGFI